MTTEEIIDVFKKHGIRIESGATFSAKGQIAQLINAGTELSAISIAGENNWCEHCKEVSCCVSSDGTCDQIRSYLRGKEKETQNESEETNEAAS